MIGVGAAKTGWLRMRLGVEGGGAEDDEVLLSLAIQVETVVEGFLRDGVLKLGVNAAAVADIDHHNGGRG